MLFNRLAYRFGTESYSNIILDGLETVFRTAAKSPMILNAICVLSSESHLILH